MMTLREEMSERRTQCSHWYRASPYMTNRDLGGKGTLTITSMSKPSLNEKGEAS